MTTLDRPGPLGQQLARILPTSFAAFVGAFGFGGALGLAGTSNVAAASAIGCVVGCLAAWVAVRLTAALSSPERAVTFRTDAMIGHPGVVITPSRLLVMAKSASVSLARSTN